MQPRHRGRVRLYRRADRDNDGELDAREFARVFDVEASNPFLPRLVRLFDVSGDGKLSPFEFIVCLSQFTSSSRTNREAHVAFAWRLFDTNDDGSMSKAEFREALFATYFRRVDAPDEKNGGGRMGKNGKTETSRRRVVGDGGTPRGARGWPTSAARAGSRRASMRSCMTWTVTRTGA